MVWIMSGPTGPDLAFGPIDPREEAEIRAYLASPDAQGRRPALLASEAEIDPDATGPTIRAAAGHVFVRDFVREQVDKAREEANRRTSAAVRANPPDPPHHPEEAEMEKDEDRGRVEIGQIQGIFCYCSSTVNSRYSEHSSKRFPFFFRERLSPLFLRYPVHRHIHVPNQYWYR